MEKVYAVAFSKFDQRNKSMCGKVNLVGTDFDAAEQLSQPDLLSE